MTTTIPELPRIDATADADTAYTLPWFADRFEGVLDDKTDEDWIAITLSAGETVTLTLTGHGPTPSADTILTLYDADGERLARNDDIDQPAGNLNSQLTVTPESDGVYYISAAAYTNNPAQDNAGGYVVTVSERRGEGGIESYRDSDTGVDATLADNADTLALAGSPHDDTLTGNAAANWLFGHGGDDTLSGGAGDDRLYAGPGFTTLNGGPGADWLVGRAEPNPRYEDRFEWAAYATSPEAVTVNLRDGTATGGDADGDLLHGIDGLIGSAHDDTLTGNRLGNELYGGAGDDVLAGGGLSPGYWDYLEGGPGADTLTGSAPTDGSATTFAAYRESPEGVTVDLHDSTAMGGDAAGDTFESIQSLLGSRHDDTLAGDNHTNVLVGGDGQDALDGREGDDVLHGDHLKGHSRGGNDTLNGGPGHDWLAGGPGGDALSGGAGQDTADYRASGAGITVRLHNATAAGGDATGDTFAVLLTIEYADADGNTQTERVPDIEHLHGSDHHDTLAGDSRDNTLAGHAGDDTLYGGPGGGDDTLHGGAGDDRLYGGRGEDTLSGGRGNDTLHGGPDHDTLYGGAGDDTFVFAPGHGEDALPDFGHGADRIDLSAFDGIDSLEDLSIAQTDRGAVIDLSDHGGDTLTLAGVLSDALTGDDFIF